MFASGHMSPKQRPESHLYNKITGFDVCWHRHAHIAFIVGRQRVQLLLTFSCLVVLDIALLIPSEDLENAGVQVCGVF